MGKSPTFIERERCLIEYMLSEYKEKYSNFSIESIEFLKQFPCIFAYEKQLKKETTIGYIRNIEVQQTNIWFDYELSGECIELDNFIQLLDLFSMGSWEWNRMIGGADIKLDTSETLKGELKSVFKLSM